MKFSAVGKQDTALALHFNDYQNYATHSLELYDRVDNLHNRRLANRLQEHV